MRRGVNRDKLKALDDKRMDAFLRSGIPSKDLLSQSGLMRYNVAVVTLILSAILGAILIGYNIILQ